MRSQIRVRLVALPLLLAILPMSLDGAEGPGTPARRRSVRPPEHWHVPQCEVVRGIPAVTFSRDRGATVAERSETLGGIGYTFGLAVLERPNQLMAVYENVVYRSEDAGCNWSAVAALDPSTFPPFLLAAPEGLLYAWSPNRQTLIRIERDRLMTLKSPAESIVGLGVDAAGELRLGGSDGALWKSTDSGSSWDPAGRLDPPGGWVYEFTFDPQNPDHILAACAVSGAWTSEDGGRTWTEASGLSKSGGSVNIFRGVISPADPNRVWVEGIDLAESDAGAPSEGRHIYLSSDGGKTFTPVVDQSAGVVLVNGPVMAADPLNPDRLLFVFGTYYQQYGTDLFEYDAEAATLTTHHFAFDGIDSIAFSPVDPDTIYFGLEVVQGIGEQ
ncbi:MAG: dispase autolysis-inducing protein [Thermoanaerobaculia bacterium]